MSFRCLQSRLALPAVLLASVLCGAAAAQANIGETIIQRCTHGQSLAGFSQSAYGQALKELSADAEEYSSCAAQIRQAQLAAAGGEAGGAGSLGTTPIAASPAEQRSVEQAAHAGKGAPVQVGGQLVDPGVVHANVASAVNVLPSPLLATVAFLLLCLLLIAGGTLRNRFRGQRPD